MSVRLRQLVCDDHVFSFVEPVTVTAHVEDGVWVLENKDFRLHGYGDSFAEAFEVLCLRFADDYLSLATERDAGKLSTSAAAHGAKLRALVRSVS
ncbi:MAG: hypothetical protein ACREJO_02350 [Phycisphaerales bacterium]